MSVSIERDWAAKTAMRLRIVQASIAESEIDEEADRGTVIWQFIADAMGELADLDERSRTNSLRLLDEEFPFYRDRAAMHNPQGSPERAENPVRTSDQSAALPPTPERLVEELLKAAGEMNEAELAEASEKLAAAGFRIAASKPLVPDEQSILPVSIPTFKEEISRLVKTVDKIRSTLGAGHVTDGVAFDLIRSMQMLGMMVEQFLTLHPQIWRMWEQIVTHHQYTTSFTKPSLPADKSLAQFLEGAATTKRSDVGRMVAKTFVLNSALVSAVENAGREFAAWFFEKFGPENIVAVANFECEGGEAGPERYWQRYLQLTGLHNAQELSEQFNNLLGRNMLRHIQRSGGA